MHLLEVCLCYLVSTSLIIRGTGIVWVDDTGGYRDIVIAVDKSVNVRNCTKFIQELQIVTNSFSQNLWKSTKQRTHISSVDVIVPRPLARLCNVNVIGTHQSWITADIRLIKGWRPQQQWSPLNSEGVGVQKPLGCGQPGDFITVDSSTILNPFDHVNVLLMDGEESNSTLFTKVESEEDVKFAEEIERIGRSLAASWAMYRWGVFEETPVPWDLDDGPPNLKKHKKSNKLRCSEAKNCSSPNTFFQDSILRDTGNENASFCNSTNHDQLQRNPQNLICMDRSAWDIMTSHPDLADRTENIFPLTSYGTQQLPTKQPIHSNSFVSNPTTGNPYLKNEESLSTASPLQHNLTDYNTVKQSTDEETQKEVEQLLLSEVQQRKVREVQNSGGKLLEKENEDSSYSSFVGVLPPFTKQINETTLLFGDKPDRQLPPLNNFESKTPLINSTTAESSYVSWISSVNPSPTTNSSSANHSVTWIRSRDRKINRTASLHELPNPELSLLNGLPAPRIRLMTSPPKAIVIALDLSSSSVAQASVEWLRGGILRWLFGIGEDVSFGILASYSNTSFPLSLGPLAPGPSTARQLEEHMALLPYQHEVDDDVYGGLYCLSCVINETEKMFEDSGIPLEAGILVLTACRPQLSAAQLEIAYKSSLSIHTLTLCQNAPLSIETLAVEEGTWALSPISLGSGLTAEVQLGHLITDITAETLMWPGDTRLQTIYEEEKILREDDVERVGAYRRVIGTIDLDREDIPRLFILSSSSPAKVVELWIDEIRVELHRDTTRRYWAVLDGMRGSLSYSLKYLSTSLELPLTVTTGVYKRSEGGGINVRVRTNTRHYQPGSESIPYLTVWAEVTKNGNAVVDAYVILQITYLSGHAPSTYSLMLLDDGSSEPDTRRGDGIYSRYLTWTPGEGRYILTVTASSTANTVSENMSDGNLVRTRTGHFSSVSSSISLIVKNVTLGDIFPPSRVTNLAVKPLANSLVNITWSAPGGDLDQGSAWRYQLKMYTERAVLHDERFDSGGIDVYCIQGEEQAPTPAPALFGTPQYCVTAIPFTNLRWFFALRAIDGANNTGRTSNIVSAFIYEQTTTISSKNSNLTNPAYTVVMSTTTHNEQASNAEDDESWRMYGAALVSAVVFVMILITVFACIICCRRARIKASKDQERPIYKIYVNNAYIQEEDGEIKVMGKEKSLDSKDPTQQWVNSIDKFSNGEVQRDEQADISGDTADSTQLSTKFPKPIRFGVLTNGSIMRELPSSSSSSSSKPSDEAIPDDFKYKDLSETISNSTTDGTATASTSSAATEISTAETLRVVEPSQPIFSILNSVPTYDVSYPPLGIPPLPGPTVISIHSDSHHYGGYNSDEDGGFRSRYVPGPGPRRHLPVQFSSFRYLPPPEGVAMRPNLIDIQSNYSTISKATAAALPHGTVRSVKKRRHISFV